MENKERFIDKLGEILMMYSREEVAELKYIRKNETEFVEINYTNGYKKYANITGDSCIAIMSDVYRAMLWYFTKGDEPLMKFEIIPVKRKQPLKAISKFIAVTAVVCMTVELLDNFVLDRVIAKKTYDLRKHLASRHNKKFVRPYMDTD